MDGFKVRGLMRLQRCCPTLEPVCPSNLNLISLPRNITCRKSGVWGNSEYTARCLGPCCSPLSSKAPAHMPVLPPTGLSFPSRVKGEKGVNPVTPLLWQPHHHPHIKGLLLNIPSQQVSNALKILLDEGNVAKTFSHCT